MTIHKASVVVRGRLAQAGSQPRLDTEASREAGGARLHTGCNPATDGTVRKSGRKRQSATDVLTRTTFERAVTLAMVFGDAKHVAESSQNPAVNREIGRSICKGISVLAWRVDESPCRLLDRQSYPQRGLTDGRMGVEYIAAGLRLLTALADRDLKEIVNATDVEALVAVIRAGRAMRDQIPTSALAGPVATAFEDHFRSRGMQARAAAADVVTSAVAVLRRVAPEALAQVDTTVRPANTTERLAVDTTLHGCAQTLTAEVLDHVSEANKLRGRSFDTPRLRIAVERLALEGFVDTPRSRQRNVEAARECVAAYVGALRGIAGHLVYMTPDDAKRAQNLCDELSTLCTALRDGPLGADIAARMRVFEYPRMLFRIIASMRERLRPLTAGGDVHAKATLEAVGRLRDAFARIDPPLHDFMVVCADVVYDNAAPKPSTSR